MGWFYGGGFIRDKWSRDLQTADAYMMCLEGSVAILSVPVGVALDRHVRRPWVRSAMLAGTLAAVALGFMLMIALPAEALQPLVLLVVFGFAYGSGKVIFWSLSYDLIPS